MNKLARLLLALSLSTLVACVDQAPPAPAPSADSKADAITFDHDRAAVDPRAGEDEIPWCERVIDQDGPCADACNPDAFTSYIPKGSCAQFLCTLDDGSQVRAGGCNY